MRNQRGKLELKHKLGKEEEWFGVDLRFLKICIGVIL